MLATICSSSYGPQGDPQRIRVTLGVVHQLDPKLPFCHLSTMDQHVSETLGQPRFRAMLISFFAGDRAVPSGDRNLWSGCSCGSAANEGNWYPDCDSDARSTARSAYCSSCRVERRESNFGGPGEIRTLDLFHAMEARSQLRHRPIGQDYVLRIPHPSFHTFAPDSFQKKNFKFNFQ